MISMLDRSSDAVESLSRLGSNAMTSLLASKRATVDAFASRPCLMDPASGLRASASELEQTAERLHAAIPRSLARKREDVDREGMRLSAVAPRLLRAPESEVGRLAATLDALSPLKVLGRGYAIARDGGGHVLKSASGVSAGDRISVQLGEGRIDAEVVKVGQ